MNLMPIIFFICILIALTIIQFVASKNVLDNFLNISTTFADKIISSKKNIQVETLQMNTKSWSFRFNKSDLTFLTDGLIILGYIQIFDAKFYRCCIILTNNVDTYKTLYPDSIIHSPKTLNLNSFNKDVHVELEFKQLLVATIEIKLKGLSDDDKRLINLN